MSAGRRETPQNRTCQDAVLFSNSLMSGEWLLAVPLQLEPIHPFMGGGGDSAGHPDARLLFENITFDRCLFS